MQRASDCGRFAPGLQRWFQRSKHMDDSLFYFEVLPLKIKTKNTHTLTDKDKIDARVN